MSKSAQGWIAAALLIAPALLLACRASTEGLATLSVPELAALLERDASVVVCDANNADTRSRYGIIPGARLLSDSSGYDVATELPAEKGRKLVFYCASELCSAAPNAARRAVAQGYSNVYVLSAGIKGWVKAQQPVARPEAG